MVATCLIPGLDPASLPPGSAGPYIQACFDAVSHPTETAAATLSEPPCLNPERAGER